jgi:hypothetical protein
MYRCNPCANCINVHTVKVLVLVDLAVVSLLSQGNSWVLVVDELLVVELIR